MLIKPGNKLPCLNDIGCPYYTYPSSSVEENKYSVFLDHLQHFREDLQLSAAPATCQIIFLQSHRFGAKCTFVLVLLVLLYRRIYGRCFEYWYWMLKVSCPVFLPFMKQRKRVSEISWKDRSNWSRKDLFSSLPSCVTQCSLPTLIILIAPW